MRGTYDVAIVGGGAAGLAAAIGAAREGASVALLERMPRLGKKILVTGGGRCNLTNANLSPAVFTSSDAGLAASVFESLGPGAVERFFRGLGLSLVAEQGRVFPVTNQAASVLKVLEIEVGRLGIAVKTGFEAAGLEKRAATFLIQGPGGKSVEARAIILACGGKSYPALGSNGCGYALAQKMGHRLIAPVPSAVPLLVKDRMCHALQGQRIRARTAAWIGGRKSGEAEGDLLFTVYGLSGTAVLDVSEWISVALNREGGREAALAADLVPFLSRRDLAAAIAERLRAGWAEADWLAGILPEKLAAFAPSLVSPEQRCGEGAAEALAAALKGKRFAVQGTRGWNEAEFTAGGLDAREVARGTLESRIRRGLFFAGEMLDVQGPRGGFNLAWAWASGLAAGRAAVQP